MMISLSKIVDECRQCACLERQPSPYILHRAMGNDIFRCWIGGGRAVDGHAGQQVPDASNGERQSGGSALLQSRTCACFGAEVLLERMWQFTGAGRESADLEGPFQPRFQILCRLCEALHLRRLLFVSK
jgi:hypothetical protein